MRYEFKQPAPRLNGLWTEDKTFLQITVFQEIEMCVIVLHRTRRFSNNTPMGWLPMK